MLGSARQSISNHSFIYVMDASSIYETAPVGGPIQDDYWNAVLKVETSLSPESFLSALQAIERLHDRRREIRWGPRTLDLDIILYGDRIIRSPNLEIPHPRMLERRFVLEPLAEIASSDIHPITGLTIAESLAALASDTNAVRRLSDHWQGNT